MLTLGPEKDKEKVKKLFLSKNIDYNADSQSVICKAGEEILAAYSLLEKGDDLSRFIALEKFYRFFAKVLPTELPKSKRDMYSRLASSTMSM